MEAEIRQQPSVLSANAPRYAEELAKVAAAGPFEMVLLAARGSSDNAALYGRYLLEIFCGVPVSLAAPSVLTRFKARVRYPKCLAVGISQSGAAPDVAEVLGSLRQAGHTTLAITNTEGSRLTQTAEHSLLLGVGAEKAVAATKTYSASLLAMLELTRALGGAVAPSDGNLPTDEWVDAALTSAREQVGFLLRSPILFTLARGFGFCTAHETALKLMECALLPCKSYSTADFEHGPKALATHGTAAIVYGESVTNLQAQGCRVLRAPDMPDDVPEVLGPIWQIVFGQWLALLAARARALDPDQPPFLSKVTETV